MNRNWSFLRGSQTFPVMLLARFLVSSFLTGGSNAGELPAILADGDRHKVNSGGAELVVITIASDVYDTGVSVGNYTFPSFPLPNWCRQKEHKGLLSHSSSDIRLEQRFVLFAFPSDLQMPSNFRIYGRRSGQSYSGTFVSQVVSRAYRVVSSRLDDSDLETTCQKLDPEKKIPGDLVARFLKINRDLRQENNRALADLKSKTASRFLWSEKFLRQPDSTLKSDFAEIRKYIYKNREIDHEVHFGVDLASTRNAPVVAANDGIVVYAAPDLGIYGKCIVVDHGCGLQSIYGHLSQIAVVVGQSIERGRVIGRTGDTGLARGDHLHFALQLNGVQIRPLEWWDAHWVRDHIGSRVALGVEQPN